MARPLNPDSGRFELKATADELRAWAAAAEAEDRPLGSWLRKVANFAAVETERKKRPRSRMPETERIQLRRRLRSKKGGPESPV